MSEPQMAVKRLKASSPLFPRQRHRHWTKPTWWIRTKDDEGKWTAVPHYGVRLAVEIEQEVRS